MSEYTPTTEEVRELWRLHMYEGMASHEVKDDAGWDNDQDDRLYAQFDRWLAVHDAEVERAAAEKAWWEACVRIADGESNMDIADTYQKQNPYRQSGESNE